MDPGALLERMGFEGPPEASPSTLAALQRAHLLHVPFDALDCHLGNRVTVEPADAYRKVVLERRGGFCFELNGLFAWLLEHLGFRVSRLPARPLTADGGLAPPFAHLALLVELDRRWLVDVGFGFPWATEPLDVDERDEQERGGRRFRVAAHGDALVAEELGLEDPNGYRFSLEPVTQDAFAAQCAAYATDPDSPFVRRGPAVQAFEDGWAQVTRERARGTRGGAGFDEALTDEASWHLALERHVGLRVEGRSVRGV
jgi:N-hydroxyarylamine O-acetyltransferase